MKGTVKICMSLLCALLLGQAALAQFSREFAKYSFHAQGVELLCSDRISDAIISYSEAVERAKGQRSAGEGVPADLLGEYAYALALGHNFDASLMNLERSRALGGKYTQFYSAQVLNVMGLDEAADEVGKGAIVPDYIEPFCKGLNEKYSSGARVVSRTPQESLKMANALAAQERYVQALAMLGDLKAMYPKEPVIYVSESTVWEGMKHYDKASESLETALSLLPPTSVNQNRRQVYNDHLLFLRSKKSPAPAKTSWLKENILGYGTPRLLLYGGATFASGMTSLNARAGLYTSSNFSASLNLGINSASGSTSGSVGLSAYKTMKNLVLGLGVSDMFSKESNVFCLAPSAGLTFPSKDRKSSFDIMLGFTIPFSGGGKIGYSVSLGKTIYIDLNTKKK